MRERPLAGQPAPAGEATARVLGGYRRTAADRGRGQAAPLRADGLAAILATAARPRTDGRGVESHTTAQRRGRLDAVIAGLLFMGGLRRSEVASDSPLIRVQENWGNSYVLAELYYLVCTICTGDVFHR